MIKRDNLVRQVRSALRRSRAVALIGPRPTNPDEVYYWATHSGAEIDLVMVKDGRMLGVECKRIDAPKLTPSMRTALDDLKLDQIAVVYPGVKQYSLGDNVAAVPLMAITEGVKGLFPKITGKMK